MDANREKALDLALGSIEKSYGKGAIMRLGDGHVADVPVIPTGSRRLGLGGRDRRLSARTDRRDLRSGIQR